MKLSINAIVLFIGVLHFAPFINADENVNPFSPGMSNNTSFLSQGFGDKINYHLVDETSARKINRNANFLKDAITDKDFLKVIKDSKATPFETLDSKYGATYTLEHNNPLKINRILQNEKFIKNTIMFEGKETSILFKKLPLKSGVIWTILAGGAIIFHYAEGADTNLDSKAIGGKKELKNDK